MYGRNERYIWSMLDIDWVLSNIATYLGKLWYRFAAESTSRHAAVLKFEISGAKGFSRQLVKLPYSMQVALPNELWNLCRYATEKSSTVR